MNLKIITLSKRSHTKEYKLYDSTYLKFWKMQTYLSEKKADLWLLGNGSGVEGDP